MASAVMTPNAFAKMEELQAKAKEIQQKFHKKQAELDAERQQSLTPVMAEIKKCADLIAVGTNGSVSAISPSLKKRGRPKGSVNVPKAGKPKGKRGRPKGSKNKPKASAVSNGKKRGRPKGSKNKPVASAASNGKKRGRPKKNKPQDSGLPATSFPIPDAALKGKDEMKLEDAILHVLQHPKSWHEHLPELPKGAKGLKVMEIAQVVQAEGLWKTSSKNPESQVSQRIIDLRKADKVIRGDEMRYRIK